MADITLTYRAKTRDTPVASEIDNFDPIVDTECISSLTFDIIPTGTRYVEIITNNAPDGYANIADGNISVTTSVTLTIDSYRSYNGAQNQSYTFVQCNVRDGIGGTLIDSVRLDRTHTDINC